MDKDSRSDSNTCILDFPGYWVEKRKKDISKKFSLNALKNNQCTTGIDKLSYFVKTFILLVILPALGFSIICTVFQISAASARHPYIGPGILFVAFICTVSVVSSRYSEDAAKVNNAQRSVDDFLEKDALYQYGIKLNRAVVAYSVLSDFHVVESEVINQGLLPKRKSFENRRKFLIEVLSILEDSSRSFKGVCLVRAGYERVKKIYPTYKEMDSDLIALLTDFSQREVPQDILDSLKSDQLTDPQYILDQLKADLDTDQLTSKIEEAVRVSEYA